MMRAIERAHDSASSGRGGGARVTTEYVLKMENKTMQSKSSSCLFLFLCLLCAIPIGNVVILFVFLSLSFWILSLSIHTRLTTLFILFFVRVFLYVAHNLIHACSWQKYFTNVYSAIRTFTFVRIKIVMIWLFPVGFQSTRTFDTASHHFNKMEILLLLLLLSKNTFVQYLRASTEHTHTHIVCKRLYMVEWFRKIPLENGKSISIQTHTHAHPSTV